MEPEDAETEGAGMDDVGAEDTETEEVGIEDTGTEDPETEDLPPSAKLVLKVIEVEGAHNKEELVDCTGLPKSTARYAAERLVDEDIIEKRLREGEVVYGLA
jgi:uncharacterized membrane protein